MLGLLENHEKFYKNVKSFSAQSGVKKFRKIIR